MKSQWVIWLLLAGIAYVSGSTCNVSELSICYDDLVHYETLAFPLYGSDDSRLDDTCGNIVVTFGCAKSYVETCQKSPECDEDCKQLIKEVEIFISNSGLEKFANDLCAEDSPLRQTYLENVECMEANADEYASCHNDSQKSLSYLSTVPGVYSIEARCCYSSWYNQCFTNATMIMCGENATMFVSYAIHSLVGSTVEMICAETHIHCDRPPFPPEGGTEGEDDNELDKDKTDQTENEIENEIHNEDKSTATILLSITNVVILSSFFIMLSKYFM